jgi:hypothetical protein
MAKGFKISNAAANLAAAAVLADLDGGSIEVYEGTPLATANTAITDQVLLATLGFGTPAFDTPVDGVAEANAISDDADANATATTGASFFRLLNADDEPIAIGTIGAGGTFDMVINNVMIQQHTRVTCSSFTYTQPKG